MASKTILKFVQGFSIDSWLNRGGLFGAKGKITDDIKDGEYVELRYLDFDTNMGTTVRADYDRSELPSNLDPLHAAGTHFDGLVQIRGHDVRLISIRVAVRSNDGKLTNFYPLKDGRIIDN